MASDMGSWHVHLGAGQMMHTWLLSDQKPADTLHRMMLSITGSGLGTLGLGDQRGDKLYVTTGCAAKINSRVRSANLTTDAECLCGNTIDGNKHSNVRRILPTNDMCSGTCERICAESLLLDA